MVKVREWLGLYMWTDTARLKEIESLLAFPKPTPAAHQNTDTAAKTARGLDKKVEEE
ncbi:MAG: hypothetical protein AAF847_08685 [Bacteroidota bacterium]